MKKSKRRKWGKTNFVFSYQRFVYKTCLNVADDILLFAKGLFTLKWFLVVSPILCYNHSKHL